MVSLIPVVLSQLLMAAYAGSFNRHTDNAAEGHSSVSVVQKSISDSPDDFELARKAYLQTHNVADSSPQVQSAAHPDRNSTAPFEYLLDKDYIDDSSNPMEEYMRQHRRRTTTTTTTTTTSSTTATTTTTKKATDPPTKAAITTTTMTTTTTTTSEEPVSMSKDVAALLACVTRADERTQGWSSWRSSSSPDHTTCVFGVDPRDEGYHCIDEHGDYGTFGWCYTSLDASSWGSCGDTCPLYGQVKQLGKKLSILNERLKLAMQRLSSDKIKAAGASIPAVIFSPNATVMAAAARAADAKNAAVAGGASQKEAIQKASKAAVTDAKKAVALA